MFNNKPDLSNLDKKSMAKLTQLSELLRNGGITQNEFEVEKAKLIKSSKNSKIIGAIIFIIVIIIGINSYNTEKSKTSTTNNNVQHEVSTQQEQNTQINPNDTINIITKKFISEYNKSVKDKNYKLALPASTSVTNDVIGYEMQMFDKSVMIIRANKQNNKILDVTVISPLMKKDDLFYFNTILIKSIDALSSSVDMKQSSQAVSLLYDNFNGENQHPIININNLIITLLKAEKISDGLSLMVQIKSK